MTLKGDLRLLRLAVENGLLSWEDLEAVPQPSGPQLAAASDHEAWGPWIMKLISSGRLNEIALSELIGGLDPHHPSGVEGESSATPETLGRYQVFHRLGVGGMGTVYKAYDPSLRRFVALKVLRNVDDRQVRRLLREAQSQARVDHPNVCQVFEVGEDDPPYIAMQHIDGTSLELASQGFPLEAKVRFLAQAAEGVHAAHRSGLIHRDLKPGNLLVATEPGGELRCVVVDFGLAQRSGGMDETPSKRAAGTPLYLAPEQLVGGAIDRRTDVYALGVVLYEILLGRTPFEGGHYGDLLRRIVEASPPQPDRVDPTIPADLSRIVLKCLAKNPSDRYDSAIALSDDLKRFLNGDPVVAQEGNWLYRAKTRIRKHKLVSATGLVALLLVLAQGAWSVRSHYRAQTQAELAQRFGEQVKEIEATIRYTAFLPPESTERHRAALRSGVESLNREMEELGSIAQGPGNYALGRTYLALHEYDRARGFLERAWDAGYQTEEVASALGRVLGLQFEGASFQERRARPSIGTEATRRELEQAYRAPALRYLRTAAGGGNSSYILALIAYYEGHNDAALELARGAWRERPWFYEAGHLAAKAQEAAADREFDVGRYGEALEQYRLASVALDSVLAVVQSDAYLHAANCALQHKIQETHRSLGEALAESTLALAACERAMSIDTDLAEPYTYRSKILWRAAERIARRGDDPQALLLRAVVDAEAAIHRNPLGIAGYKNLAAARRLLGVWQSRHGVDARPNLEAAVEAGAKVIELQPESAVGYGTLGNVFLSLSQHLFSAGSNGEPELEKAAESYRAAIARNPQYVPALINAGNAWKELADRRMRRGDDPTPWIENALTPLRSAVEINPNIATLHNNLGNVHLTSAEYRVATGKDPNSSLAAARAAYAKALALRPDYWYARHNLAFAYRLEARHAMAAGQPTGPPLAAARRELRQAQELNPTDADNLVELARIELLAARSILEREGNPSGPLAVVDGTLERLRGEAPQDARADLLQALRYQARAHWLGQRRANPIEALQNARDLAAQAYRLNPELTEALALRGALESDWADWLASGTDSAELAASARRNLTAALAKDRLLALDYGRDAPLGQR